MMQTSRWIKKRILDYRRFVFTLLIVSCYLYAGSLISLYEYQTDTYLYLYPVIATALAAAFIMIIKIRKMQQIIDE